MLGARNHQAVCALNRIGPNLGNMETLMKIQRFALALLALTGVFGLDAGVSAQGAKKSDSVVRATATANKADADGKQAIVVILSVDKGWHTYANPVPKDFPGLPTHITIESKVKPEEVKVDYPTGKVVKDSTVGDYNVYEDKTEIKINVRRAKNDPGPLTISVQVQACSDKQCLLPSTIKLTVP